MSLRTSALPVARLERWGAHDEERDRRRAADDLTAVWQTGVERDQIPGLQVVHLIAHLKADAAGEDVVGLLPGMGACLASVRPAGRERPAADLERTIERGRQQLELEELGKPEINGLSGAHNACGGPAGKQLERSRPEHLGDVSEGVQRGRSKAAFDLAEQADRNRRLARDVRERTTLLVAEFPDRRTKVSTLRGAGPIAAIALRDASSLGDVCHDPILDEQPSPTSHHEEDSR